LPGALGDTLGKEDAAKGGIKNADVQQQMVIKQMFKKITKKRTLDGGER